MKSSLVKVRCKNLVKLLTKPSEYRCFQKECHVTKDAIPFNKMPFDCSHFNVDWVTFIVHRHHLLRYRKPKVERYPGQGKGPYE